MASYTAYGLTIDSEIRLPELDSCRAEPDVHVRLGDVPASPDEPTRDGQLYEVAGGHYLTFEGIGSLFASDGRTLLVAPTHDVAPEVLRWLVLGHGFRMVLHQRGYVVLHASAVNVDGRAVAFIGDSGQGKSTMAAGCHAEGHTVLADDVTPIDPETDEVVPGFQQVKLDREAVESINAPLTSTSVSTRRRQYYVVPSTFDDESVTLHRVYLLADGSEIEIEPLPPSGRPFYLMSSSTSAYGSPSDEGIESHLDDYIRLSSEVPVKRLERPRELDALTDVVSAVEADLAEPPQTER